MIEHHLQSSVPRELSGQTAARINQLRNVLNQPEHAHAKAVVSGIGTEALMGAGIIKTKRNGETKVSTFGVAKAVINPHAALAKGAKGAYKEGRRAARNEATDFAGQLRSDLKTRGQEAFNSAASGWGNNAPATNDSWFGAPEQPTWTPAASSESWFGEPTQVATSSSELAWGSNLNSSEPVIKASRPKLFGRKKELPQQSVSFEQPGANAAPNNDDSWLGNASEQTSWAPPAPSGAEKPIWAPPTQQAPNQLPASEQPWF